MTKSYACACGWRTYGTWAAKAAQKAGKCASCVAKSANAALPPTPAMPQTPTARSRASRWAHGKRATVAPVNAADAANPNADANAKTVVDAEDVDQMQQDDETVKALKEEADVLVAQLASLKGHTSAKAAERRREIDIMLPSVKHQITQAKPIVGRLAALTRAVTTAESKLSKATVAEEEAIVAIECALEKKEVCVSSGGGCRGEPERCTRATGERSG